MEDIRRMEEETRKELDEVGDARAGLRVEQDTSQSNDASVFLLLRLSDASEGPGERDGGARGLRLRRP